MTKIEWTEQTWNPVTGCTKVSQGCKHCYAERLAPKVFAGQRVPDMLERDYPSFNEKKGDIIGTRPRKFTDVRTHPDRLDAPLHWRKPRRVFVNSMSDLFHEDVPDSFLDKVFAVMALSQGDWGWFRFGRDHVAEGDPLNGRHTFQVLTKRPERMARYLQRTTLDRIIEASYDFVSLEDYDYDWAWPLPNVWLGVSVEDQPTADERIPLLLQTPAAVRFISAEPLLGAIDIARYLPDDTYLNWVISGGESGPKARPSHPDWFRSLRDQCVAAGVPFFMKQITDRGRKIDYAAWPPDLQVREYPNG